MLVICQITQTIKSNNLPKFFNRSSMNRNIYLGFDIGGTWIKGIVVAWDWNRLFNGLPELIKTLPVVKVKSRLSEDAVLKDFLEAFDEIISKLLQEGDQVKGIGISTAGIVDYHGKRLLTASKYLHVLLASPGIGF